MGGLAFSSFGGSLATKLSFSKLVAFQGFRFPLELVLHSWVNEGVISSTMTWTGSNFDIVTGILALLAIPLVNHFKWMAWIVNGVGLALLLNVMRVVILSSPLSFSWHVDPPLELAFHIPYFLIVPVCVAGDLSGHLVLTRKLLEG